MLFVPFTVPTFPATHQTTSHPVHQTHHQQLGGTPVQQQPAPPQINQLNQLNHSAHQGIGTGTTNPVTVHSTNCSPQQQHHLHHYQPNFILITSIYYIIIH
uniref:Uncharacterized protein n=1 Tax=Bracon brevicornis TaxID=1563983 RepID=A0A6V7LB80_9HYME